MWPGLLLAESRVIHLPQNPFYSSAAFLTENMAWLPAPRNPICSVCNVCPPSKQLVPTETHNMRLAPLSRRAARYQPTDSRQGQRFISNAAHCGFRRLYYNQGLSRWCTYWWRLWGEDHWPRLIYRVCKTQQTIWSSGNWNAAMPTCHPTHPDKKTTWWPCKHFQERVISPNGQENMCD